MVMAAATSQADGGHPVLVRLAVPALPGVRRRRRRRETGQRVRSPFSHLCSKHFSTRSSLPRPGAVLGLSRVDVFLGRTSVTFFSVYFSLLFMCKGARTA